eukprot:1160169-Pelagomonas_calceolata.AAC.3
MKHALSRGQPDMQEITERAIYNVKRGGTLFFGKPHQPVAHAQVRSGWRRLQCALHNAKKRGGA